MTEQALEARARSYADRLISYRPRSEKELSKRLKDKGYSCQIINRIINGLKEEGLIDDKKFAKLWARMRSHTSPRGPSLIKMELLSKGIDRETVEDVVENLKKDFNEEEIARELFKKRLRLVKGLDRTKAGQRLFGYLKRRGFSSEVIYKLLNEAY